MIAVLRDMTPTERLAIAHGMWSHARHMILQVVRAEHPDWDSEQVTREVAQRISHGSVRVAQVSL